MPETTPEQVTREAVTVALRLPRVRGVLQPLVTEAAAALTLAAAYEAEEAYAHALWERGAAQTATQTAATLLYGAVLGAIPALDPGRERPVQHECARVIQEAVQRGALEVLDA